MSNVESWIEIDLFGNPTALRATWLRQDGSEGRHFELLDPGATLEEAVTCIDTIRKLIGRHDDVLPFPDRV